jgi:hypothetical protein
MKGEKATAAKRRRLGEITRREQFADELTEKQTVNCFPN